VIAVEGGVEMWTGGREHQVCACPRVYGRDRDVFATKFFRNLKFIRWCRFLGHELRVILAILEYSPCLTFQTSSWRRHPLHWPPSTAHQLCAAPEASGQSCS
jgi:hypothetical protein